MKYVAEFTEQDAKGVLECGPFAQKWHWKALRSGRAELKVWLEVTVPACAAVYAAQRKTDIHVRIFKHVEHSIFVERKPR